MFSTPHGGASHIREAFLCPHFSPEKQGSMSPFQARFLLNHFSGSPGRMPPWAATGLTRRSRETPIRRKHRWRGAPPGKTSMSDQSGEARSSVRNGAPCRALIPTRPKSRAPERSQKSEGRDASLWPEPASGRVQSVRAPSSLRKRQRRSLRGARLCFFSKEEPGERSDGLFAEANRSNEGLGARTQGRAPSPEERREAEAQRPAVRERRTPWVRLRANEASSFRSVLALRRRTRSSGFNPSVVS